MWVCCCLQEVLHSGCRAPESALSVRRLSPWGELRRRHCRSPGFAPAELVKNSTTLSPGETGTYTGNDGKTYDTICIGTQEWMSEDLRETKYRGLSSIPNVTDNTAWFNLSTGAYCIYNNDLNNVGGCPTSNPTIPPVVYRCVLLEGCDGYGLRTAVYEPGYSIGDVVQYWIYSNPETLYCGTITNLNYMSIADISIRPTVVRECDDSRYCNIPNPDAPNI